MKALLVVGLVLLLVLVGLPVAMGMGMGEMEPCPACPPADITVAGAMCLAILVLAGIYMGLSLAGRLSLPATAVFRLLLAGELDRPPQHP